MMQFIHFGLLQVRCCLFPAGIFIILGLSKLLPDGMMPRYDFILLMCLLLQYAMVRFKLETLDEFKVICLFHVIGLALELYKVHMGSWAYPEFAVTKWGGVPLYSGFMYASVASYICQAWKVFDLSISHWPKRYLTYPMATAIYLNFFTHHYVIDLRWILTGLLFIIFYKSMVSFTVLGKRYTMSMMLSYVLIGFFIWVAENISTYLGAWQYPDQAHVWKLVHLGKISSWFLLVIISVTIVVNLKQEKYKNKLEKTVA